MTGTDDLAGLTVRLCEYCGRPIPARRKDARYCSTSHRVLGNRKAKKAQEIHDSLVTRQGGEFTDHESLTDAYERQAEFARADASYVVPHDHDCDEQNIYFDDAGHEADIEPVMVSQPRPPAPARQPPGRVRPARKAVPGYPNPEPGRGAAQLARLRREYAAMAQQIIDNRERTSALERADRTRGRRAEDAHDRAAGQRAMAEFAQDLRHRGIDLPNAGRATSDVMGLRENANPFAQDNRSMWKSSGIAGNMMQSGFGSFPGDARSWR